MVKPQAITTSTSLLQVTTSVGTYKASAPAAITLEKGKSYGYNFNLKRSLVTTNGIDVSLSETELEYTGSVLKPTVTVKYGSTTLTQDTDYTLSWSNSTSTAIGSYTVTVTGKGAYTGSVKKTYSIVEVPPYVTFTASGAQTFTMTLPTDAEAAAAIGTFEYSVGGGTWTAVTSGKDVSFGGDKGNLRLRGTGLNSAGSESLLGTAYHGGYYSSIKFGTTASVEATGDIRTLISYKNYSTVSTANAKFCYLFKDCTALTYAPKLPATALAEQCYQGLFTGCKNLTEAPALPATTLVNQCYYEMFSGCETIEYAPQLKATTLARYCCYNMFSGCTNLKEAPALSATTLATYCYCNMFQGCTKLETAPTLSATTLAEGCYSGMFKGCTKLTDPGSLPATKLEEACYYSMFYGCTALKKAPTISAESLAYQCCQYMFYGCTALTEAPALPVTTLAESCYQWMFSGCTALKKAPALPATTLAMQCYYLMFQGCTSLETAPALPATNLANSCYYGMFYGCANLSTVTTLPATKLANSCYKDMFRECTSLTKAPAILATTLASSCCQEMFYGCKKLKSVTIKATKSSYSTYSSAFENWLYGVDSSGTVYKNADLALPTNSADGIPTGWNSDNGCFYVEAVQAGSTVSMTSTSGPAVNLIYSTDGSTWSTFTVGSTTVTLNNAGDKVYFKAGKIGSTAINSSFASSGQKYNTFSFTGKVNVGGDITTLLTAGGGRSTLSRSNAYAFYHLFYGNTSLISAENLLLPSVSLADHCYYMMFALCTALTAAPDLPATKLAASCYRDMFNNCSALTDIPDELPATTLAESCYFEMFNYCKSLTKAPKLPATTLAKSCYYTMLRACNFTTAPELPATTLEESCYERMFESCKSLTTAPELPAETLASSCYNYMFQSCTNLKSITIKAQTYLSGALDYWLNLAYSKGTIYYTSDTFYDGVTKNSTSGIPSGWTATKKTN